MLQKLHKSRGGFTLVEIMIVVAIIALLAAIAVPGFLRARKRSQATRILEDLRMIDAAVDQYAIEYNLKGGDTVPWASIKLYLKPNSQLYSTQKSVIPSITYDASYPVDAQISTPTGTGAALSDVCPSEFWLPFTLVP
jgi:prepilin-type N-terminal cleavage/methylation domain-containing protein